MSEAKHRSEAYPQTTHKFQEWSGGWEEGRGLPSRHILGRSQDWAEPLRKSVWVSTRHPGVGVVGVCVSFPSNLPHRIRAGQGGNRHLGFPTTKAGWPAVHLAHEKRPPQALSFLLCPWQKVCPYGIYTEQV